mmetsp:Transcript_29307/g.81848  ORF Transcript_29307/g.81848 Transcript_29307/m.81848 type:complete len:384 (-) Transcript_29307:19-1170(-)
MPAHSLHRLERGHRTVDIRVPIFGAERSSGSVLQHLLPEPSKDLPLLGRLFREPSRLLHCVLQEIPSGWMDWRCGILRVLLDMRPRHPDGLLGLQPLQRLDQGDEGKSHPTLCHVYPGSVTLGCHVRHHGHGHTLHQEHAALDPRIGRLAPPPEPLERLVCELRQVAGNLGVLAGRAGGHDRRPQVREPFSLGLQACAGRPRARPAFRSDLRLIAPAKFGGDDRVHHHLDLVLDTILVLRVVVGAVFRRLGARAQGNLLSGPFSTQPLVVAFAIHALNDAALDDGPRAKHVGDGARLRGPGDRRDVSMGSCKEATARRSHRSKRLSPRCRGMRTTADRGSCLVVGQVSASSGGERLHPGERDDQDDRGHGCVRANLPRRCRNG